MVGRLSTATLDILPAAVARPAYTREGLVPGILHFGPGAFHRAHQAAYADAVLAHDPRWGVSAVALNSTGVADALDPQDGLYALALLGEDTRWQVVGSLIERLTARDRVALERRFVAPETRLVTATVTEKGYCLTPDGDLDRDHPAIARDIAAPDWPTSYIGWVVRGLALRRARGLGGLTLLSCDNLAANGRRQARAVTAFARAVDPDLARWIKDEVRFPSSVVDAITPATDDALRAAAAGALGVTDAWPIQRERFTQWVIEDAFVGGRPPFDGARAQYVTDVEAFENAKLRLLNGGHSTLAYLGLLMGHETVRDAMADPALAGFVERLMRDDVAGTMPPAPGLDVPAYIDAVLARFRNPAIRHSLWQIAWDGSQKLPFRLIASLADARRAGREPGRLTLPLAAWARFLALPRPPAPPLVDPLADRLLALDDVDRLVEESGVFPDILRSDGPVRDAMRRDAARLDGAQAIKDALGR